MNKNLTKVFIALLFLLVVPLAIGCKNTEPVPNPDEGNDYFITSLEEGPVTLTKGDVYTIKYDTNIPHPLTFESSNEAVAIVNEEGEVTALQKGKAFINCYYEMISIDVEIEVKEAPKVKEYLTVFGQDKIELRDYKMTIAVYLKYMFGDKMHKDFQGKVFMGYYLDEEFKKPVDLQEMIDKSLTIYPKYVKDETISDMMISIYKVLIHNSEVLDNDNIVVFSADFGDTVKYQDLTYENYLLATVRYDFNKNAHYVTSITLDGNKSATKIPYDGFVIAVPKANERYDEIRNGLKVNDKIDLDNYSINRATKLYVNKEFVKYAQEMKLNINCKFISVYDATNEVMIYEKNQYSKAYPASTTKIITALAALQHCSLDTVVTIGDELDIMWEGDSPGTADLRKGQKWTMRQLLYAMLLPSGNDAAYSVAAGCVRSIPGNENKPIREILDIFNGYMNDVKDQVGATRSHFMVPDGNSYYNYPDGVKEWDDRITNHYVTSDDMLKFARLAFNYPGLALVTSTNSISLEVESANGKGMDSYSYRNTNRLLRPNDANYYPYAVGMKTGTTNPAGQCLVAGAYRDGRMIIVSLMYNEDDRFYNAKKIFETVLQ